MKTKTAPIFAEILKEVDRMLEFAPYSIKSKVNRDIATNNLTFRPK